MTNPTDPQHTERLAYQIWEDEGRPHGKHEEHWAEAERRLNSASEGAQGAQEASAALPSGMAGEQQSADSTQDTPGRPKSSSSRQQTQPRQALQTGTRVLDGISTAGTDQR